MSKAVLVMDMPSSCDVCDFVQIDRVFGNMTCMNPISEVYECDVSDCIGCREEGCPLRELPDKKELYLDINNKKGYCEGYNACIDELLGEEHGSNN